MTCIRRCFPHPILTLLLVVVWLLMSRNPSLGNLLLGSFFGVVIPLMTTRFWDIKPKIHKPWKLIRFIIRVLRDIVTANLEVAWLIINPWQRMRPAFVVYPLTLTQPFAVTMLANTISLTPGTVSANLRMDGKTLLIHALDVEDEETLIATIWERYERPLQEIYEC